jgi:HK97 family phage prohead protease
MKNATDFYYSQNTKSTDDSRDIIYKYTAEGECKTLDVDVKTRRVKNALNKVGVLDTDKDIIDESAYNKTIQERGPSGKNLIWHQVDHSGSLTRSLGKFQELYLDKSTGYLVGVTDIRKTTLGNDILEFYSNGDINQHSIGFSVVKRDVINPDDYNNRYSIIRELKLYEGSAVLWGANEDTPNLSVGKSDMKTKINIAQKYLGEMERLAVSLRKGNFTDETCELLECRILKLRTDLKHIFDSLLTTTPPVHNATVEPVNETNQKLLDALQLLTIKFNHL